MKRSIIIAEAGVNHNGDFELAKQLISIAAEAKADYVKFQTFKADKIVSKESKKAAYQIKNMADGDDSQYLMLKKLELPEVWHIELKAYAESQGIKFLSTGFDTESIDFLDTLGLDFFKIPSGEITNKPYLQHIAGKGKPVVLSTGMANMDEVRAALQVLETAGLDMKRCTVLHCNTEYPTPFGDVNLRAMLHIQQELKVAVGYSDHTRGIEIPIAAVALGATVIEKHFTVDVNLPGPDHKASLEPAELKAMVASIRNVEDAMRGSGVKEPSSSETENIKIVRKSLHYAKYLPSGHTLKTQDLVAIRPGSGISPMLIDQIVGRVLRKSVDTNQIATLEDFQ